MEKIIIGSDKSGYQLKEAVKAHLEEQGYTVDDCGTTDVEKAYPYTEVAHSLAKKIEDKSYEKGILICGTGMGMSIVANAHKGVYAAVVENTFAAKMSRAINNANVLTMGGFITADFVGCEIVDTFLNTDFTQGLEDWRQDFVTKSYQRVQSIEEEIY